MNGCFLTLEQAKAIEQQERQNKFECQSREELKDFIEANDIDTVINYIQSMERKIEMQDNTIYTQKTMMADMVAKSIYNAIVKEYNKKEENKTKWKKTL